MISDATAKRQSLPFVSLLLARVSESREARPEAAYGFRHLPDVRHLCLLCNLDICFHRIPHPFLFLLFILCFAA